MNWKLILALFIIVGITGLLLFSEKGRDLKDRYLGKYVDILTGYFSKYTGKIIPSPKVNRTLSIEIKISSSSLKKQEFDLVGSPLSVNLKYDSVSLGNQNIKLKNADVIDFNTESMTGTVIFDENNKMTISGSANSIELNGLLFFPPTTDTKLTFNLVGSPSSFSIENFEDDKFTLSDISGTLTLSDWSPLTLHNDNLDIYYIKGSIKQDGDSISIKGNVERISLNGIDLSLKS
jgi:hypothetical protein